MDTGGWFLVYPVFPWLIFGKTDMEMDNQLFGDVFPVANCNLSTMFKETVVEFGYFLVGVALVMVWNRLSSVAVNTAWGSISCIQDSTMTPSFPATLLMLLWNRNRNGKRKARQCGGCVDFKWAQKVNWLLLLLMEESLSWCRSSSINSIMEDFRYISRGTAHPYVSCRL